MCEIEINVNKEKGDLDCIWVVVILFFDSKVWDFGLWSFDFEFGVCR